MPVREHVFGYGSLLHDGGPAGVCRLAGVRRTWNVAMDNRRTIAGYKYYLDRVTGERPAVCVTFLNLRPEPSGAVNGVAYPVDPALLALLDARERNYERRDVTGLVDPDPGGRVWAYFGTPAALRRHATGRAGGGACVAEDYFHAVRDGFARLGADALDEFVRTTDELEVPLRALRRVDLDGGAPALSRGRTPRGWPR